MSISSADTGDVCMKSPESLRGAEADRFDLVTLWEVALTLSFLVCIVVHYISLAASLLHIVVVYVTGRGSKCYTAKQGPGNLNNYP